MIEGPSHTVKRHGRRALALALLLIVASIFCHWGWNTVAAELFGAPSSEFKHGFAFASAVLALAALVAAVFNPGTRPAETA